MAGTKVDGELDMSQSRESADGQQQEGIWREAFEWEVGFPVEEVWEVTSDYGNIHKWAPTLLASCTVEEGTAQEVGCVRLVETHPPEPVQAREKLLEFDPASHKVSYVVVGSSTPFFVGLSPCFQLLPMSPSSTKIVWSYHVRPLTCIDQASLRNIVFSSLYEICINDLIHTLSSRRQAAQVADEN